MEIRRIDVFRYDIAYAFGAYTMSGGRSQTSEPALVVRITSDDGRIGWGEAAPHGGTYLPQFFAGELAALQALAPALVGLDPREPSVLHARMRSRLLSGSAAKSALDIACRDLAARAAGVPVASLLGGRLQETVTVFEPVPVGEASWMAGYAQRRLKEAGTHVFQVKVGNDPYDDVKRVRAVLEVVGDRGTVVADANGGWTLQQAIIAVRELRDAPVLLEQPCAGMAACAEIRQRTDLPMILDECVTTVEDVVTARSRAGAGGVSLKPGRVGGLSVAALLRDVAVELGMTVTVDETWGGTLATAANSHLAGSTPSRSLLAVSYFNQWTSPRLGDGPDQGGDGRGVVPAGPGLGVRVDEALLTPVQSFDGSIDI